MSRRNLRRGSVMLEFTLAGIPLVFAWISVVEMALTSWRFHTLEYAAKNAGAYVAVHGSNCSNLSNSCSIQIRHAAAVFRRSAVGIPASMVTLRFKAFRPDHTSASPDVVTCTLTDCLTSTTAWPPAGYNDPGCDIEIRATYTGPNASGWMIGGGEFTSIMKNNIPAETRQPMMF